MSPLEIAYVRHRTIIAIAPNPENKDVFIQKVNSARMADPTGHAVSIKYVKAAIHIIYARPTIRPIHTQPILEHEALIFVVRLKVVSVPNALGNAAGKERGSRQEVLRCARGPPEADKPRFTHPYAP
jgi:hypothetical protein